MTDAHRDETVGEAPPGSVTLTTGRIAEDAVGALLLAVAGPPLPLARLVAPATAPPGVTPVLTAALGIGPDTDQAQTTDQHNDPATGPATLQFKAAGVFVVVRVRDRGDLVRTLDGLPAQVARLVVRGAERRLVYEAGAWHIDP